MFGRGQLGANSAGIGTVASGARRGDGHRLRCLPLYRWQQPAEKHLAPMGASWRCRCHAGALDRPSHPRAHPARSGTRWLEQLGAHCLLGGCAHLHHATPAPACWQNHRWTGPGAGHGPGRHLVRLLARRPRCNPGLDHLHFRRRCARTWTSQLFVLADYYNVQAASPNFAADYTANKEKYAKNKTALRGFEYIEELKKLNYFNRDYASTTYAQALDKVALGQGAHYPMATWAIPQIASQQPANLEDVGFFAQPGPKASVNGVTVWVPSGTYIPANTKNAEAAKKFVGWMTSAKAVDVMNGVEGFAGGPYYIKNASIPNALPGAVKDVVKYFEKNATAPALEFVSPIKGPNLEKILIEVGLGITTAKKAAAAYDADVVKQAKQLGLKGW